MINSSLVAQINELKSQGVSHLRLVRESCELRADSSDLSSYYGDVLNSSTYPEILHLYSVDDLASALDDLSKYSCSYCFFRSYYGQKLVSAHEFWLDYLYLSFDEDDEVVDEVIFGSQLAPLDPDCISFDEVDLS